MSNQLVFPEGIFHGKENNLRISDDKIWVSAYDIITLVGEQNYPRKTWDRIMNEHKNDIVTFCHYVKFTGIRQKPTPAINAKGVVLLLMWIPGEIAKQFRSHAADILIRYLGGDTTLIEEVQAIDQIHRENPDNAFSPFRQYVESEHIWKPSKIDINLHNYLLETYEIEEKTKWMELEFKRNFRFLRSMDLNLICFVFSSISICFVFSSACFVFSSISICFVFSPITICLCSIYPIHIAGMTSKKSIKMRLSEIPTTSNFLGQVKTKAFVFKRITTHYKFELSKRTL